MKSILSLVAAVSLSLSLTPASAQSFRCQTDLVTVGDSRATLLQKCGEPSLKESFCKPNRQQLVEGKSGTTVVTTTCENVDEWTYNPGSGQLLTTLTLEAGKITSIRNGGRAK